MENSKVEKAFEFWINQHPESYHPLDQRRFYDFVELAAEKGNIDKEWLKQKASTYDHNLTDDQLDEFGSKLETIKSYINSKEG